MLKVVGNERKKNINIRFWPLYLVLFATLFQYLVEVLMQYLEISYTLT